MAKRDYYEVLGVSRDASVEDLKKAYRKIAVQNHPDRNPGDAGAEERFKEAAEAYEVLANPEKRQAYDQFGFAGVDGLGGGPQGFSSSRDFEDIFGDFSDIFGSFFGGGGRSRSSGRGRSRGSDLRYDLQIPFTDAAFGTKAEIAYEREAGCDACNGSGASAGSGRKTCPTCGGAGQVRRSSGFFSVASVCPSCQGSGTVIEDPCPTCSGSGVRKKRQRIKVTIPAGVSHGQRITIPGQGDAPRGGGEPGDLHVVIHIQPHKHFERDNYDLYCAVPVSITQAALGTDLHVATLDGKRVKVKVPAGTQDGKVLRLRNEGIPVPNSANRRGDMYIKLRVVVPAKMSGKARDLLREFSRLEGEETQPEPIPLKDL
ncbi:molecular chaperone DnaJ [Alkalispirochaeta sphaeroplastigenens]|uniref:Chaperone protein DnaJ n=1 Tax=Alkalispirochaeta sphaeroplastigenens TaxID=1187066 RepID=A0A2S4JUT5_9SPIO|nr:molecular chaperone DnaJ [Alkalispirochaeta sphaeroplastigenens]POR03282.1 molecular chaperone DnaJ [Alkalispirochaeta sphaeroplastigenens]